jgi:short-subunit dehydrogenase
MSLPKPSSSTQVLVTGASSGIGAEIAKLLAGRGHNLAIVARRRNRLEDLASELQDRHKISVTVFECDLGDAASRTEFIDAVATDGRALSGVANCAGFGTAGKFLELDVDRELNQLDVNVGALMHLTHALAPGMVQRKGGAILNIASLAAFQPIPTLAVYAATKAFVQSFSEALHEEWRGTGVSCTVLCPGPVETEWGSNAGADAVMSMGFMKVSPQNVAKAAVEGMEHGSRSVVPGIAVQAASLVGRHAPRTITLPLQRRILGR